MIPALTPSVLLRFAQQPEALPSLASLPASPWLSCGVSSSSWRLTHSSQLASSLTPAHPPGGPCALGLGCASNLSTQSGSEIPDQGFPASFPSLTALAALTGLSGFLGHSLCLLPCLLLCLESPPLPASSGLFSGVQGPSQLLESSCVPFSTMSSCTPRRYTVVSPAAICLQTLFGPSSH